MSAITEEREWCLVGGGSQQQVLRVITVAAGVGISRAAGPALTLRSIRGEHAVGVLAALLPVARIYIWKVRSVFPSRKKVRPKARSKARSPVVCECV